MNSQHQNAFLSFLIETPKESKVSQKISTVGLLPSKSISQYAVILQKMQLFNYILTSTVPACNLQDCM